MLALLAPLLQVELYYYSTLYTTDQGVVTSK